MNGFRIVAALGITATLVGCGQVAPPPRATPVHFTILTKHGGQHRGIFAGTSADDLRSQELTTGAKGVVACTAQGERGCLAKFNTPPGSLLVGMQPVACADNNLDTTYLLDRVLTFVINWTNTCPPGARSAAVPEDWIVAVPLRSLPQIQLPLKLDFVNGGDRYTAGRGLVDLRAVGPGHTRAGNFTLEATPLVAKGQAERITLTVLGLDAFGVYRPWTIDLAALDTAGRLIWHQAAFGDATASTCLLVGASNPCDVESYKVEMPTAGVSLGSYLIRPSFVYPADNVLPQQQAPSRPPFELPTLTVEVVAG